MDVFDPRNAVRNEERQYANATLARRRDEARTSAERAVAQQALADANIGVCRMWARRYGPVLPNFDFDELVDVARSQLFAAAGTWSPDGGSSFSAWASFGVRARLSREVSKLYGRRLARVALAVAEARMELEQDLARSATVDEVAGKVGLRADRVAAVEREVAAIQAAANTRSLDRCEPGRRSLLERTASDMPGFDTGQVNDFGSTLAALPARQRRLAERLLRRDGQDVADVAAQVAAELDVPLSDVEAEFAALFKSLSSPSS